MVVFVTKARRRLQVVTSLFFSQFDEGAGQENPPCRAYVPCFGEQLPCPAEKISRRVEVVIDELPREFCLSEEV
jgi:hypothetical protein